jgi:hypothetical protein
MDRTSLSVANTSTRSDAKEYWRTKSMQERLAAHNTRFLLIGGYAVNAFGYIRNTVDMDVRIAADEENQQRVIAAIREFGFAQATVDLFSQPDAMVRMGVPPLRIEV